MFHLECLYGIVILLTMKKLAFAKNVALSAFFSFAHILAGLVQTLSLLTPNCTSSSCMVFDWK